MPDSKLLSFLLCLVFTEDGRVFRGTINVATRLSMIHSKSFKPRIGELATDFTSERDLYSGKFDQYFGVSNKCQ